MAFNVTLTRKPYQRGDIVDAADFSNGFVQSVTIADGQSYRFAAGSAEAPSIGCSADDDTGLAFSGDDSILFVTGGQAVGVATPTGFGMGTVTPNADAVLHLARAACTLRLESLTNGAETKLRMINRGSGPDTASTIVLEHVDAEGGVDINYRTAFAANGPGGTQFTDGGREIFGSTQMVSAQPIQLAVADQLIVNLRQDRFQLASGKALQLGYNVETHQPPNCSIRMLDADGRIVYISAYQGA